MTSIEEIKKELKSYIYDKMWVEKKLEDIKERRSLLDKITTTLSNMPKGSKKIYDNQVESLSKIMDLTSDLEAFLKELNRTQIELESRIDKMEQPYKNILYFRYIKGYNLTEVAGEIDEEYDYTRKLHGIALVKYRDLKDKEMENVQF